MAASADNLASAMEIASKSKWRRRFNRRLQSNANLGEEAANLAPVADGQAHNEVEHHIKLEDLDNLLKHIEAKIQCLSTSSTPAASSSKLLCLSRHKEISSFMESFPNDVKKEGGDWLKNLVTRALGGAGGVHWLGLGLSLVAWTLDNFEQTAQNRDDCIQILQRIVFLLSNSKEIWEAIPEHDKKTIETLQDTVSKAFRCAIVCTSYLNNNYFLRFLEAPSAKDAIASLKQDLGCAAKVLDQHLITQTFLNTAPNIEPQYGDSDDDDSVGEPVLAAKEKAMEYFKEDPDNAKALCLHGMGGIGKSTLGLSIFKCFQSCRKSYRYCRVELPFGIKDEQLHTIQNQILEKACRTKGTVSNPGEGKGKLKEELKKMDGPIFLFMDNVLESSHLGKLLPKASCFPGGSRILVTTRYELVHSSILDDLKLESSKLIEVSKWEEEVAKKFLWKQISRGQNKEVGGSYPEELEKRVLALCDGLPLALKVVGRYIRNDGRDPTDPQVWKEVEEAMKNANPLDGSVEDELYCRLMFSLTVLDKDCTRAFLDIIAFGVGESWEAVERMLGGHRHLEGLRKRALVRKRRRRKQRNCDEYLSMRGRSEECVEVHDVLKEIGKKMVVKDKDEVRITDQDEVEKESDSLAKAVGLKTVTVEAHQLKQMQHLRILHHVRIEGECQETQLDHLLVVHEMECRMNCITFGSKLKELSIRKIETDGVQNMNLKVLKVCHKLEILKLDRWDGLENVDVIQSMTCLKELCLARCKNLQSLPEGISNLSKLKELTLTNCKSLQSLPEGISGLKDLTELYLLCCTSLQSLPESIGCLTGLTGLYLGMCRGLQSLPEAIGCLTGLTALDLGRCGGLQSLPEAIGCLTGLTALYLGGCGGLQSLPEAIGCLTGLTALYLGGCGGLQSLPEAIGCLTGLTHLDLIGCGGLQSLPESIGCWTGLTGLYLRGCGGLQSLPESIGCLTGLTGLHLSMCGGLQSLPEAIGCLTGLTGLYMIMCRGLQSLPEAIGCLTGLTDLDLRMCGGLQSLPESIGCLTGLTGLNLSMCGGLQSLPEAIGCLTGLTELELSRCEGLQSLPEAIGCLTGLTDLDLSRCGGLQSLPESIGCLTGLTGLYLSMCRGLQSLPESIGCLTGLTGLELSGCEGLQSLPEAIGCLTGLTALDLSGCEGLQSLPEAIGCLTGLTDLDLSGCRGLQSLPNGIARLTQLTKLNLSEESRWNCSSSIIISYRKISDRKASASQF